MPKITANTITTAVPLGGAVPGGAGSEVGAAIMSELDWEGVPEDSRDVEAAKKVIEVGGAAAQQVAALPPNAPPQAAAQALQSAAAQQGIATDATAAEPPSSGGAGPATSGRWIRRGRSIVLIGI